MFDTTREFIQAGLSFLAVGCKRLIRVMFALAAVLFLGRILQHWSSEWSVFEVCSFLTWGVALYLYLGHREKNS